MSKLTGKVAIITGGNSGIGLATAKVFLQEGAKLVLSGRRQEALDEVSTALSGDYVTVLADASRMSENEKLIRVAVEKYGKIDILFLNAGIAPLSPIAHITEEHFNALYNTNVKGPLFTVKAALPHFNEGAVVIFNASVVDIKGFPGMAVYASTKAALRSMTRVLANELAPNKIRVVSVAPGGVNTPIMGKLGLNEQQLQEMATGMIQSVPLGRFAEPEEIAQSVLFLASDSASYITGIQLEVDGGQAQV